MSWRRRLLEFVALGAFVGCAPAEPPCPPRLGTLEEEEVEEPGRLTPRQISERVLEHYEKLRDCWKGSESQRDAVAGSVSVAFSIAPDGSVSRAEVAPFDRCAAGPRLPELKDEGLTQCLLVRLRSLEFPEAELPSEASWTFAFKPKANSR